MNDATSSEARREAARDIDDAARAALAKRSTAGISEADAYLLACRRFFVRVGEAPNAAQRLALMQQVRRGFIDGHPVTIDHDRPAPQGFEIEDVTWFCTTTDRERGQFLEQVHAELSRTRLTARIDNAPREAEYGIDGHGRLVRSEREARTERATERMDGLTIAEAAEATGSTARAIRARVDRGTLRAWKGPDGKRRIPRADLVSVGLLEAADTPESAEQGSGSGSAANVAPAATTDLAAVVLTLTEKIEQTLREAAEHRLLTVRAETRLEEAQATAARFEEALHEARSEAAVARHEADTLRQQLDRLDSPTAETPANEEDSPARRRWFRRRN